MNIFKILDVVSNRSDCIKRKVGAIIVDNSNVIVGEGYNKIISYSDSCRNIGCKREDCNCGEKLELCDAIHAEIVAIESLICSNRLIEDLSSYSLYVTTFPCHECAKAIISLGIGTIYYIDGYVNMEHTLKMFKDNGITVVRLEVR